MPPLNYDRQHRYPFDDAFNGVPVERRAVVRFYPGYTLSDSDGFCYTRWSNTVSAEDLMSEALTGAAQMLEPSATGFTYDYNFDEHAAVGSLYKNPVINDWERLLSPPQVFSGKVKLLPYQNTLPKTRSLTDNRSGLVCKLDPEMEYNEDSWLLKQYYICGWIETLTPIRNMQIALVEQDNKLPCARNIKNFILNLNDNWHKDIQSHVDAITNYELPAGTKLDCRAYTPEESFIGEWSKENWSQTITDIKDILGEIEHSYCPMGQPLATAPIVNSNGNPVLNTEDNVQYMKLCVRHDIKEIAKYAYR